MDNARRVKTYHQHLNRITYIAFILILFCFSGIFLAFVLRNVFLMFLASLGFLFSLVLSTRLQYHLDKKYRKITTTWKEYLIMTLSTYVVLILLPFGIYFGLIFMVLFFARNTPGIMIFVYLNIFVLSLSALFSFVPWHKLMQTINRANKLVKKEIAEGVSVLAGRLGVEVGDIYVLPRKKIKIAEAFQMGVQPKYFSVFISDYLLENLTKEEINAIIAHELAHARERHLLKTLILLVAYTLFLLNLYAYALIRSWRLENFWMEVVTLIVLALVIIAFPCFLLTAVRRRFELKADSMAVYALGDFRPFVSALEKLAELNLIPKKLSRIVELLAFHPSIETRIEKIKKVK